MHMDAITQVLSICSTFTFVTGQNCHALAGAGPSEGPLEKNTVEKIASGATWVNPDNIASREQG